MFFCLLSLGLGEAEGLAKNILYPLQPQLRGPPEPPAVLGSLHRVTVCNLFFMSQEHTVVRHRNVR